MPERGRDAACGHSSISRRLSIWKRRSAVARGSEAGRRNISSLSAVASSFGVWDGPPAGAAFHLQAPRVAASHADADGPVPVVDAPVAAGGDAESAAPARRQPVADQDGADEGAGGALRLDTGGDGHGLSLSLLPSWGAVESGLSRLWEGGVTGRARRCAGGCAPGCGVGVRLRGARWVRSGDALCGLRAGGGGRAPLPGGHPPRPAHQVVRPRRAPPLSEGRRVK